MKWDDWDEENYAFWQEPRDPVKELMDTIGAAFALIGFLILLIAVFQPPL